MLKTGLSTLVLDCVIGLNATFDFVHPLLSKVDQICF